MKTQKDFINNFASNKELAKKTLKQGGIQWDVIAEYPNDYYAANTGAVTGMIYYADTVKFAKANRDLIFEALEEFEQEIGEPLKKPSIKDKEQYFNWLAWFAWENTMSEVINYLED